VELPAQLPQRIHSKQQQARTVGLVPMQPPLLRSASRAYPSSNNMRAHVQYFVRQQHCSTLLAMGCVVVLALVGLFGILVTTLSTTSGGGMSLKGSFNNYKHTKNPYWGGAIRSGYFFPTAAIIAPNTFRFAAVTDLDELSRVASSKKPEFYSTLTSGMVTKDSTSKSNKVHYTISLEHDLQRTLTTAHNEAGRGAELSELTLYQDRLITLDDRTGNVYEILNNPDGTDSFLVPRFVVTEGNGETDKGMKWEWSTVKDGEMYMGSMGKEYTRQDGSVKNRNNLWIGILNNRGELSRKDWTNEYGVVRKALKADAPGYMIIEACRWSAILNKWVFMPRRISHQAYDENKDEKMGGHQLVLVDDQFKKTEVVEIKLPDLDPLKGFSTFAFIPNSGDRHVLAIRSVEEDCVNFTSKCLQRSYFIVIDILTGEVLSDEVQHKDNVKYEGVEFVDIFAVPPKLVEN
jgi:soluble calcium-activated nucleotidase 1